MDASPLVIDSRVEPDVPFTEADLMEIERIIGRLLPKDYRDFVAAYGGAFVGGLVDGDGQLPIMGFFSADVVLSELATHTDLGSDGVLPFADCELGNLYVLDKDDVVHYINYYGGRTSVRRVAESFSDLLPRIVVSAD